MTIDTKDLKVLKERRDELINRIEEIHDETRELLKEYNTAIEWIELLENAIYAIENMEKAIPFIMED